MSGGTEGGRLKAASTMLLFTVTVTGNRLLLLQPRPCLEGQDLDLCPAFLQMCETQAASAFTSGLPSGEGQAVALVSVARDAPPATRVALRLDGH